MVVKPGLERQKRGPHVLRYLVVLFIAWAACLAF